MLWNREKKKIEAKKEKPEIFQEMLEFCSKHNISSDIECIPIQKVNEAYERVVNSDFRYRFVIDNKSL
ncbi:MAG TPA: hypothetical protein VE089_08640 [Nitrososphaeraceae archaeon]|nr:hypothetical protein [Nitrososphaeraceae archaeon]